MRSTRECVTRYPWISGAREERGRRRWRRTKLPRRCEGAVIAKLQFRLRPLKDGDAALGGFAPARRHDATAKDFGPLSAPTAGVAVDNSALGALIVRDPAPAQNSTPMSWPALLVASCLRAPCALCVLCVCPW